MTIKDLATKTGYAVGTVSRALNNHPNVSEKARRAILAAAQESGFQLNLNAKQLKQLHSNSILVVVKGIGNELFGESGFQLNLNAKQLKQLHSNSILVVVKGIGNELFGEMLESIQSLIAQTRYQLMVDYLDEDSNEVAVQLCRQRKPLCVVFLGGSNQNFLQDFSAIDVTCVVVTNDASQLPSGNLSSVTTDDTQAARAAVETLISLGHRHIAIIGGDCRVSDISRLRYEGCMKALQQQGLPYAPEQDFRYVSYSYQDGYQAVQELLDAHQPPAL